MQAQVETKPRSDPRLRAEYDDGTSRVVLTNCRFKCQKCMKWKPASEFGGLRKLGNGDIRNQSRCSDCR